jgi:hypothetical protein
MKRQLAITGSLTGYQILSGIWEYVELQLPVNDGRHAHIITTHVDGEAVGFVIGDTDLRFAGFSGELLPASSDNLSQNGLVSDTATVSRLQSLRTGGAGSSGLQTYAGFAALTERKGWQP